MKSNANQFANGVLSYVPITGDVIDPTLYIDLLTARAVDEFVCPWKDRAPTSRLRSRLPQVGVENSEAYSWHSLRPGAAHLASKNGVADCVIKKHGHWASHTYLRHVAVDTIGAGREVRDTMTK